MEGSLNMMGKRLFPARWATTLLAGVVAAAAALGPAVPVAQAQASQAEPTITDVRPEHWAYQAVVTLVQRGYLTLQAGRFDGSRPVDRYTLAAVIARLLQDVESGQTRLSGDDLRLVRQLTNEFREELARWQDQRSQVNQRLDAGARDVSRIDAKLTEVLAQFSQNAAASDRRLTQVEQATQTLNQQLGGVSQRVTQVENTAKGLGTVIQDLQGRLDGLDRDLAARRVELVGMSQSVQALERTTASLQNHIQALTQDLVGQIQAEGQATSQRLQASSAQLQQLQAALQAQQQELGTLRTNLDTLITSLSRSGIQPEQAGALLSAQQESLQRLQASTAQIDKLNADLATLRQQLAASEQERRQLRSEVDSLRAALEQERARTDEIVKNLVRDPGGQLTAQRDLQAEVESLRTQSRWLMAAALAGVVLAVAALIVP
ncbi:MAG: hypothetical protein AB1609_00250 [Bacillota bacterium]